MTPIRGAAAPIPVDPPPDAGRCPDAVHWGRRDDGETTRCPPYGDFAPDRLCPGIDAR